MRVCLSHAGIALCKQPHMIAQRVYSSDAKDLCEIWTWSPNGGTKCRWSML